MSETVRPHSKAARQARISELVRDRQVTSQQELADLLAADGYPVTQGTLSRDLVDIGAVRVRNADGMLHYALRGEEPQTSASRQARLGQLCSEVLFSAEASANLVILKTPPGAAQYLASAIDQAAWQEILGTIAGDDTILLVTRLADGGQQVADRLLRLSRKDV